MVRTDLQFGILGSDLPKIVGNLQSLRHGRLIYLDLCLPLRRIDVFLNLSRFIHISLCPSIPICCDFCLTLLNQKYYCTSSDLVLSILSHLTVSDPFSILFVHICLSICLYTSIRDVRPMQSIEVGSLPGYCQRSWLTKSDIYLKVFLLPSNL